jgi:two-component system sensor histidine kinase KdpD
MIYLLTVVGVAARLGRGPSVLASVLAVAAFDFFFVLPYYTFAVANKSYLWTFTVMLVVALTISTLTARLRRQAEASSARERRANALYLLSRDLAEAPFEGAWLHAAVRHTAEVFGARVIVLMPTVDGELEPRAGDAEAFGWNEGEARAARWVFDYGRPAGRTTETLPAAQGLYVPLPGPVGDVLGVLGLSWGGATPELAVDQLHLLETFANQLAIALRRPRRPTATSD